jgi:hypothetical protein
MATTTAQPRSVTVLVSDTWLFDGIDGAARGESAMAYQCALREALWACYPTAHVAAFVVALVRDIDMVDWCLRLSIDLPASSARSDWAMVAQTAATLAAAVAADTDRWLIADEPPAEPRTAE